MKKSIAIKPFIKLTDRAASANYELSKRAILLHERLLGMGGPYLTNKSRLIMSFESYEEPLKELASKGLIIVVGEDLLNPYYFTDTETPSGDYRYKKVPQLIAARLFVSSDLIITEKGSGGTLDDFQEKIWGEKPNRYKGESGIKTIWASYCRELEGRYREETRQDQRRLEETRLDKTRQEEARQEYISSPSSCSSTVDLTEDDLPFGIEEEEQKRPLTNEQQSFLNWWNALRDDRGRKSLIEKTRKESWGSFKAALPKQDKAIFDRLTEEIEDSLPF